MKQKKNPLIALLLFICMEHAYSQNCTTTPCNFIANSDFSEGAPWSVIPNACTTHPLIPGNEPSAPLYNFQNFLSCWDGYGTLRYYYFCSSPGLQSLLSGAWVPTNREGCQWGDYHYQSYNPVDGYVGLGTLFHDDANQYPGDWQPVRQYLHQQLPTQLTQGNQYRLKISLSLAERSGYATNGIQALLTNCVLTAPSTGYLPVCACSYQVIDIVGSTILTDYDNPTWERYDIPFTAISNYSHIYIGNFRKNPGDGLSTYGTPPLTETVFSNWSDPGNCNIGGACAIANQAYYYVDQVEIVPPVTLNVTAVPNPVCLTSPLTPVTLNVTSNMAIVSVQWTPAAGLSCATCATTTATPSANTTYNVSVTTACGVVTGSVTVNVLNPPAATATSNSPVCSGTPIYLDGGGGVSYAWTGPNGFSSSQENPVIPNASASMAGNYSVTVTDGNGCTNTATTSVSIIQSPTVAISPPYVSMCEGSSANLTASGANSYSWSPTTNLNPTTGPVVTANPSITTVYTVTGTNANGCTGSAQVNVIVNNHPSPFQILGNNNTCNAIINAGNPLTTYCVDNPVVTYTYFWSINPPAPFNPTTSGCTGIDVDWTSTAGGTITCMALTNSAPPCTTIVTLDVIACCDGDQNNPPVTIVTSPSNTNIILASQLDNNYGDINPTVDIYENPNEVVFNCNLLIDPNTFTMVNCPKVKFNTDYAIINQKDLTIDNCRIESCDMMWTGIQQILPGPTTGSKVTVKNGSYIADAFKAIHNENGEAEVSNSTFNMNFIGIAVNCPQTSNSTIITGSLFDCTANLKPSTNPVVGSWAKYGVGIFGTQQNDIGVSTPGMENTFQYLSVGVYSLGSRVNVYRNNFYNIQPYDADPESGCGVFATDFLTLPSTLYVETRQAGEACIAPYSFDKCKVGVFTYNSFAEINYNCMLDCEFGVFSTRTFSNTIHITENTIENAEFGISLIQNPRSLVWAAMNNITVNSSSATTLPQRCGIKQVEDINDPSWTSITDNIISTGEHSLGVLLDHAKNSHVLDNIITDLAPYPAHLVTPSRGIWTRFSPYANMECNEVHNYNYGISVEESPLSVTQQNVVQDNSYGLHFTGDNNGSMIRTNIMQGTHDIGLLLENTVVGPQGSFLVASGNQWIGTFSGIQAFQTGPNVASNPFYVNPSEMWQNAATNINWVLTGAVPPGNICNDGPDDGRREVMSSDNSPVLVYPNPVAGTVNIFYQIPSDSRAKIEVFNSIGQMVFSKPLEMESSHVEFDASRLGNGLYSFEIITLDGKLRGIFAVTR